MTIPANHAIDELVETFEFLDDWEQRYAYLIDLGRKLPPMDDADKTDATRVRGCQSTVWMVSRLNPGDPPTIEFLADSDAHIVKGLIAVLQHIYSGRPASFIERYDAADVFRRLGLEEHLSPTRRTGLHAMVKRIKALAAQPAG